MQSSNVQSVIDTHIGKPFHLLKATASQSGFRAEYGQTYSMQDIRDNIRLGNIPVISIKDETLIVAGEAPGKFLLQKADGMTASFSDTDMAHLWPGEATIFFASEKVADKYKKRSTVLLDGIRSDWNDAERQDAAQQAINRLERVPQHMLPNHPVILVLQDKLPENQIEFRNGVKASDAIRAYSIGASIFLIDKSDPLTEMYHEMGHIFWRRLTPQEQKNFVDLLSRIDQKAPPAIIESAYEISHPEEFFCTIYMWALKGAAIADGYQEILDAALPDGAGLLRGIFSRIEQESNSERMWDEHRSALASGIKTLADKPQTAMVDGMPRRVKLIKAVESSQWPKLDRIPAKEIDRVLIERDGIQYVTMKDALFDDMAIPVRDGFIAYDVLTKAGKRAGLVPIHTVRIRPEAGIVIKQEYKYPSELKPETIDEGSQLMKTRHARVGDIRELDGQRIQKQSNGTWVPVMDPAIEQPSEISEPENSPFLVKARDVLHVIWNWIAGK